MPQLTRSPEMRFWEKVEIKGLKECWAWKAACLHNGYGVFRIGGRKGRQIGAHCFSLQIKLKRTLQPGEWALHNCDNPPCVNPNHLSLGNAKKNTRDMIHKDRGSLLRHAKLDKEKVRTIRERYDKGEKLIHLSKEFKVNLVTISFAVKGITWKSAKGPIQKADMRTVRNSGIYHPRKNL